MRYLRAIEIKTIAEATSHVDPDQPLTFVASTEARDRYSDVIRVQGWQLDNYMRNPIVLFGHQHDTPVGRAEVWTDDKALMSEIRLAERGTAPVVDYVRELVRQRILRAVSVGFIPTAPPRPLKNDNGEIGMEYVGQELVEISLVAVPANPETISIARAVGLASESPRTMSHRHARLELIRLMPRMAPRMAPRNVRR